MKIIVSFAIIFVLSAYLSCSENQFINRLVLAWSAEEKDPLPLLVVDSASNQSVTRKTMWAVGTRKWQDNNINISSMYCYCFSDANNLDRVITPNRIIGVGSLHSF